MPDTSPAVMNGKSHVILKGSARAALPGARSLGRANPEEWIEVTVKLRRKEPLPDVVGRPEKALTPDEFAQKYGASTADIANVTSAFGQYGLKVVDVNATTRTVRLGGPTSAMEKAFNVKLFRYAHERGNYRGRTGVLQVPADAQDIIKGVFGLDDRRVVKQRRSKPGSPPAVASAAHRPWFFPAELAQIYDFPPGDGAGQSIGLIEFGGGFFPDDLNKFCTTAKLPVVPTVTPVSVDHAKTNRRDGAEGEVMLDVEVIAGVCPKARIAVYFSQFSEQGWVDVLDAAVHDTTNAPTVLSISWGMAEDDPAWSAGAIDSVNDSLKEAALLGITICVSAGDDGSDDQVGDGNAHVDFPASSPFVLAVGGTTLRAAGGTVVETAWKDGDGLRADGGGATGGGVSTRFPRPSWQNVSIPSVNPHAIDGRCVPDVAADASANTGYFVVVDGSPEISGGTSASAPLWAALIARINAARLAAGKSVAGFVTPLLYQATSSGGAIGATACRDITTGDNATAHGGGYSAQVGYDAVTGWGVPVGTKLLAELP